MPEHQTAKRAPPITLSSHRPTRHHTKSNGPLAHARALELPDYDNADHQHVAGAGKTVWVVAEIHAISEHLRVPRARCTQAHEHAPCALACVRPCQQRLRGQQTIRAARVLRSRHVSSPLTWDCVTWECQRTLP
jgi:hypothetical protein